MWWRHKHLSDTELLLLDDGELSAREEVCGRTHLACCQACETRRQNLAAAMRSVRSTYRDEREPAPATTSVGAGRRRVLHPALVAVAAAALVTFLLLAPGSLGLREDPATRLPPDAGPLLPRPDLTPGRARAVSLDEVCGSEPLRLGPRVADDIPRQVFEAYGADFSRADEYELDFLVTPELGGTTEVGNLWPQPFVSTEWNAYVKDELERRLQTMVCEGRLDLETAQRQLAVDWIAAYKRLFDTDRPLRGHGTRPSGARNPDVLYSDALERQLLPDDRRRGATRIGSVDG